jgi:hypothetical protein
MWLELQSFQEEWSFELEAIDIDRSTGLQEKYGTLIPVLAAGDEVLCNYYFDPMSLKQFLNKPVD